MANTYSAGIATAYGAAVRGGYTGTYDDFCRQQAEYAESAAAVEQAKEDAESAASAAEASETAAAGSATAAATSAGQASTSATNAADSATAANASKNAAATSAGNAENSATAAAGSATTASQAVATAEAVLESIPEDYSTLSNDVADLKSDIGVSDVTFTEVSGKYISKNSNETSSAPFSRSVPIAVSKGEIINFTAKGYNTEVAMIAVSNADATSFTAKVISVDSTVRLYTYTVETDGYIVVSYNNGSTHNLVIKSAEISNEALNNRLDALNEDAVKGIIADSNLSIIANDSPLAIGEAGKYVNKNSGVSNASSFNISVPITLEKGQYLIFNAKGYLNEVAVLARVNSNSTYTALIKSVDNDEHTFKYLALEDMTVVVSSIKTVSVRYSIFSSRIDEQDTRISELEKKSYFAFSSMGVIGDSLASGASNYSGGAKNRKLYSWGKCIEREHGVDVSLFSFGGATTRTWFTSNYGYTALQSADVLDLYVIGLGVNDAYELGSEYLGTIADVHVGDESLNADTYYGNYSKIIAAIKAKSPRAKIICLTNPKGTGEVSSAYNQAVRNIVALYTNTYLIDLINDSFYTSAEFNATWYSAHSTAVGYKLISENIYKNISELIRNNVSEFLDIQWIIENHA